MHRHRAAIWFYTAFVAASALCIVASVYQLSRFRLPYRWRFASQSALGSWQELGGVWRVVDGTIANDSEERGAKLMSGAARSDYQLDADVQLRDRSGDAGLIVRSSAEEEGVDAYRGYYIGLRAPDNTLTIGRTDYSWQEAEAARSPQPVLPLQWYHLHVVAVGCSIAAQLTDMQSHTLGAVVLRDSSGTCFTRGRIGLRSVSTSVVWRNVQASAATQQDLQRVVSLRSSSALVPPPSNVKELLAYYQKLLAASAPATKSIAPPGNLQMVRDLPLLPAVANRTVLVRGEVTLLHPVLYVQDATGGVEVLNAALPPLKIGDQVEVEGQNEAATYPPVLRNGSARLLWPSIPSPPLFISIDNAVAGAYEGRLIELEGRLVRRSVHGSSVVLELVTDHQRFEAVLDSSTAVTALQNNVGSLLRITGVCTSNQRYRSAQVPFVLLLRSAEAVQTVGGPPWWSARNLSIAAIVLAFLLLLGVLFYIRAEQWRLNAVVEERQRLAHELHDTLAQSFAGIGLQLRALRRRMPATLPGLQADLDLAAEMVRQGHQEARQSISMLRPVDEKAVRLLPALVSAAHRIIADDSICIQARMEGEERTIPLRTLDVLFRAGQEGIANVVRHASAKRISITVTFAPQNLILQVQDDGIGVAKYDHSSDGFGLKGIAKRVEAVHGSVRLHPASPSGSCLTVEIPLASANPFGRAFRALSSGVASVLRRSGTHSFPRR